MPFRHPSQVLVLALLAPLAGCPDSSTAPPADAALAQDARHVDSPTLEPSADEDADGLCNSTEVRLGTDPFASDTDGDGYPDFVEIAYGYDAAAPASPPRERVVVLREHATSAAQVPIEQAVRGTGEAFLGGFSSELPTDDVGLDAFAFFDTAVAVYAQPPDRVQAIEAERQRFVGVRGRTLLGFEVRVTFGEQLPRRCARAYPFRYNIKREGVGFVASQRYLIAVLPDGDTAATATWCAPPAVCQ